MSDTCTKVGRGLLLYGPSLQAERGITKAQFLRRVGVKDNTFRSAGEAIGSKEHECGLRFFRVSDGAIAFGPGAGLVLGLSVGSSSLRAAIVDANGRLWHAHDAPSCPGQLTAKPSVILDRIREAVGTVFVQAREDDALQVNGALPLLGVAVAWPGAVDRNGMPVGRALANDAWHGSKSLVQWVADLLEIEPRRSHALGEANAAALAVAYDRTCDHEHERQEHAELMIVVHIGGGISGATIIVEPPDRKSTLGVTSGFTSSVLIGDVCPLAGEIGHVCIRDAAIREINRDRPDKLNALRAVDCSCRDTADSRRHLEAYAAVGAITRRVAPDRPRLDALEQILAAADNDPVYTRALEDVGTLLGEALLGPVAWLNPATIVLTGSLCTAEVRRALNRRIDEAHPIVSHPDIRALDGKNNKFVRVRGAALSVIREEVHKQLPAILGGPQKTLPERVERLTKRYEKQPWHA
jgi:predicted NBD/HSP70 family sugar kinase